MMLSIKNFVFKKRLAKKLVDQYVGPYIINKVFFTNAVKLPLLTSIRIYLVVNVSQIIQYREQEKVEEVKLVEVNGVKE